MAGENSTIEPPIALQVLVNNCTFTGNQVKNQGLEAGTGWITREPFVAHSNGAPSSQLRLSFKFQIKERTSEVTEHAALHGPGIEPQSPA